MTDFITMFRDQSSMYVLNTDIGYSSSFDYAVILNWYGRILFSFYTYNDIAIESSLQWHNLCANLSPMVRAMASQLKFIFPFFHKGHGFTIELCIFFMFYFSDFLFHSTWSLFYYRFTATASSISPIINWLGRKKLNRSTWTIQVKNRQLNLNKKMQKASYIHRIRI